MRANHTKRITIEEMDDGCGNEMECHAQPSEEHPNGVMEIHQGSESVWVDTAGAKALAEFLLQWAERSQA